MSWIRCSGSSFACAALGCERAGDVNHVWMGAVMGRSAVASAGVRQPGFGLLLGMATGGYTTTAVSSMGLKPWVMASMLIEGLPESASSMISSIAVTALTLFSAR